LPHGPHARQVETALENYLSCRSIYATGHGPQCAMPNELTRAYRQWSLSQTAQDTTVAALCPLMEIRQLWQSDRRGITKAGVGVESINCEFAGTS